MDMVSRARIKSADVLDGAVIVTFEDGTAALYSAELMRATLPQAECLITESEEDGE